MKYLSAHQDFLEYENLAKRFPDSLSGQIGKSGPIDHGILIVYGILPEDTKAKVPHAFVDYKRLIDEVPLNQSKDGKTVLLFKGETEVMNELNFLAQGRRKRKIYVLQGDGELDVENMKDEMRSDPRKDLSSYGCSILVDYLQKNQFDAEGLTFADELPKEKAGNKVRHAKDAIPEDAETVIIPGASETVSARALDALERYMDRGGKMLVYLDTTRSNRKGNSKSKRRSLEAFLRKYAGVLVGPISR